MTSKVAANLSLCIMRAMPIAVNMKEGGLKRLRAAWGKNHRHYFQEALGLAIFMIAACFFGALLEGKGSTVHNAITNSFIRMIIMGVLMGATALFIFYSPVTAPSGAHINPAVTITFLRIGSMCYWDAIFFILFQVAGGTIA